MNGITEFLEAKIDERNDSTPLFSSFLFISLLISRSTEASSHRGCAIWFIAQHNAESWRVFFFFF